VENFKAVSIYHCYVSNCGCYSISKKEWKKIY
jgi:hypothetical protein